MVAGLSALKAKRYIATELRRMRGDMSRRDVVKRLAERQLSSSDAHLGHLETGRYLPSDEEVRVLLDLYNAPEHTQEFLQLAKAARDGRDWFDAFRGAAPEWFDRYLAGEYSAARLESFSGYVFHGLLQTATYAESIIRGGEPHLDDEQVARRAELRLARQIVFHRQPTAPTMAFIIDESVLYRSPYGHDDALAEQLKHVLALCGAQNITIRLLPFSAGTEHPGVTGSFTLVDFPPELIGDPGMAYVESRIRGTTYEATEEVARYRTTFDLIATKALDPEETRRKIEHRAKEIS